MPPGRARRDCGQNDVLVELRWQRELHEDAVDIESAVQLPDSREEVFLRVILRQVLHLGEDADLGRRLLLQTHVAGRAGVIANNDTREHRDNGVPGQYFDARAEFLSDLSRDLASVEYDSRHLTSPSYEAGLECYLESKLSAAATVFVSSMAVVTGPVPPGTGVIAPAFSATASKSTSPTRRALPLAGSST